MRRYETIFILRPTIGEEQINTIIDNTTKIIQSDKGQIIESDKWGVKKLAYPIKKETLGFYVFFDYAGTPEAVSEIERKFRIDDAVLRYLSVKTADAITAEQADTATAELAVRRAAAKQESENESDENLDDGEIVEDADIIED
ncbi:MAG: 30S ribosomal protein S6 [Desulfocapsaceae bacterium]|nr:30S ribosomal protein S6 [Desulfocapsaceae bacterium]